MTTPNLDATGHWWVGALVKFNFWLEYQKGWDNAVADTLSWIATCLGPEAVQSILDGATIDAPQEAEEDPAVIEGDQQKEKEVWVAAGWVLVEMHFTNWSTAQKEDPELEAVLQWLESKKKTNLRTLLREQTLSEKGQMIWRNCQNFTTLQGTLYLCSTPKEENEDLLLFMVPKCTGLPPLMGVIGMQDIKATTVLFPCYKNISGGQEWPSRWDRLSRPVGIAPSIRVALLRPLYAL